MSTRSTHKYASVGGVEIHLYKDYGFDGNGLDVSSKLGKFHIKLDDKQLDSIEQQLSVSYVGKRRKLDSQIADEILDSIQNIEQSFSIEWNNFKKNISMLKRRLKRVGTR